MQLPYKIRREAIAGLLLLGGKALETVDKQTGLVEYVHGEEIFVYGRQHRLCRGLFFFFQVKYVSLVHIMLLKNISSGFQ